MGQQSDIAPSNPSDSRENTPRRRDTANLCGSARTTPLRKSGKLEKANGKRQGLIRGCGK